MSEPYPEGTIVLHIGPHKTGTTALQNSLWHSLAQLRAHGIAYPGRFAHEMDPAMAVALNRVDPGKNFDLHVDYWHRMLGELRAESTRIGVLSSEFYAEAKDERIAWLLDTLGDKVQVVITLRPLARIIPSQWQQYVQGGLASSYSDWLHNALDDPDAAQVRPSFWGRHRHDRLVRRWVTAAGRDRVRVVVVDDRDPASLPAAFEQLLGLPEQTLKASEEGRNRSLSFDEVEMMRALNLARLPQERSAADYDRFVRFGAARGLQAPERHPEDQRLLTPAWAVERALELGGQFAEVIASTGVEVIGSLDLLHDPRLAPATGDNDPVLGVSLEAAAALAAGAINRMAGVPGGPELRAGAGPIELAAWRRHRLVNHLRRPGWAAQLEAEREDLLRVAAEEVPAASATRTQVLRELARRGPAALRRRAGRVREAGRKTSGK